MGRLPAYDREALRDEVYDLLATAQGSQSGGLSFTDLVSLSDCDGYGYRVDRAIQDVRRMGEDGWAWAVTYERLANVYRLTDDVTEVEAWLDVHQRGHLARLRTDAASVQAMANRHDGRTLTGRRMRQLGRDLQRVREDLADLGLGGNGSAA